MLDKGYRSTVAAWYTGNQLIMQPDFKKSDMKFRGVETISSAGVATDCSANERGVKYSKSSGVITVECVQRVTLKNLMIYGWHGDFK